MFYFQEETFHTRALKVEAADWKDIATGTLEMSESERNNKGLSITSTYESGDTSKFFAEASFFTNVIAYSEYRYVDIVLLT